MSEEDEGIVNPLTAEVLGEVYERAIAEANRSSYSMLTAEFWDIFDTAMEREWRALGLPIGSWPFT